jgi:hypothetical protein
LLGRVQRPAWEHAGRVTIWRSHTRRGTNAKVRSGQVRPAKSYRKSTLLYERQTSLIEGVALGCGGGTHGGTKNRGKRVGKDHKSPGHVGRRGAARCKFLCRLEGSAEPGHRYMAGLVWSDCEAWQQARVRECLVRKRRVQGRQLDSKQENFPVLRSNILCIAVVHK